MLALSKETKETVCELKSGEDVILVTGHAYEYQDTKAMPNSPDAVGTGHWEVDGTSVKFVKS